MLNFKTFHLKEMKKLTNFFLSLVLAVTAFAFVFPVSPAFAESASITADKEFVIVKQVTIKGGTFDVDSVAKIPAVNVRSAVVGLVPEDATGTINGITIALLGNKTEKIEFGCPKLTDVKNGDDLILRCGGPAGLAAGVTEYKASGSFSAPSNPKVIELSVTLGPNNYSEQYQQTYGIEEDETVTSVQDLYGL